MPIDLSPETERLLADRVAIRGYSNPDEAIRDALEATADDGDLDELDIETLAAIAEGEAQANRGEGRPLAEVREELRQRFGLDHL